MDTQMNSAVINSILARCLLDSAFLEQLSQNPDTALRAYGLDARTYADFLEADIARIRSFAGFIAKVQHNHLFEAFPNTRALLKFYGLELRVFTEYLEIHQQNRTSRRLSRDQRTEVFLEFLRDYISNLADSECPGLPDVLSHEQAIWEIKRFLANKELPQPPTPGSEIVSLESERLADVVPSVNGIVRPIAYRYDPVEVISALQQKRFDPKQLSVCRKMMCYWGNAETYQLRVFEVNSAVAALLALVDGYRSVADIVRHLTDEIGSVVPISSFLPFFESAVQQGILTISVGRSKYQV